MFRVKSGLSFGGAAAREENDGVGVGVGVERDDKRRS